MLFVLIVGHFAFFYICTCPDTGGSWQKRTNKHSCLSTIFCTLNLILGSSYLTIQSCNMMQFERWCLYSYIIGDLPVIWYCHAKNICLFVLFFVLYVNIRVFVIMKISIMKSCFELFIVSNISVSMKHLRTLSQLDV